jgi:hypothetical protein
LAKFKNIFNQVTQNLTLPYQKTVSPDIINIFSRKFAVYLNHWLFAPQTGTLTEEGLDLWGVLPIKQGEFCAPVTEVKSNSAAYRGDDLTMAMASAHSLTIIDHRLSGDPLDLKVRNHFCS